MPGYRVTARAEGRAVQLGNLAHMRQLAVDLGRAKGLQVSLWATTFCEPPWSPRGASRRGREARR